MDAGKISYVFFVLANFIAVSRQKQPG